MEILEKIKEILPKSVSRIEFEGAEIIIYTKDLDFFKNSEKIIKEVVQQVKKRIEVRPDKSLLLPEDEVRKKILEIVPKEAEIKDIVFEKERSIVNIYAKRTGLVIGKGGETFKKIREETLWKPKIERAPLIDSQIVDGIRKMFHEEVDFRKNFLNELGKKIFSQKTLNKGRVRLTFLGGAREVGRSCLLVETLNSKILIDAGIISGSLNGFPILNIPEFNLNEIDAIVASHAHLDHVGFIPTLYEMGYDGPLYLTTPTLDLSVLLWLDFIEVSQRGGVKPLFTIKGVREALKRSITLDYEEVTDITSDVKLTFYNSGHILGGSIVHLHVGEGLHNIIYALDQKFGKTNLLDPAYTKFQRVETLIIESTYGAKNDVMPKRSEVEKNFMEVVNKTMDRGGIVLIPSFSVERAQELMTILVKNNFLYPVYLDGMIWDANGIFTAYPEYYGKSMYKQAIEGKDPFLSPIFKRISSPQEREKAWNDRPCVIISTSGMLNGGPVLEHLKYLAEDERNTLIFVGYQAEGTLGRKIQKGLREVPLEIDGKVVSVNLKMEVYTTDGLSAHSDRKQLLAYVGNLTSKPKRVFVVHGEEEKTISLAKTIEKIFKIESYAPRLLETLRVV
ncbi:MAG: beta-CASP ribonuclease aCPSF1 [Candidatus Aenigmarchaeota archaeon]|nr:beta-CASP ribonuclease aCPSF1 [Candidatus Aenigmarchaeota archaeon]MCX8190991.1 beta-CASP ribonuclease aCPSF1 [Candidatus Aenigmarchaeota archaeon]MDW8160262.1 beta-CASP ribonuclease aCPSF1 [Candidatus Aenigmarchaeota archaeon]